MATKKGMTKFVFPPLFILVAYFDFDIELNKPGCFAADVKFIYRPSCA